MSKIYIAGPMTSKQDWNMGAFHIAEGALSKHGHTVLNPANNIPLCNPESISHEEYMRIALAMLDCCDTIYMLQGWENSKGAKMELQYAVEHRKMIEFEPTGSVSLDGRNLGKSFALSLQAGLNSKREAD